MLSYGRKINETNNQGFSALILAIERKNKPETVKALLKFGADPNHKTMETSTPLMLAVADENNEAIDELLAAKADPSISTWDGLTPLMIAARKTKEASVFKN